MAKSVLDLYELYNLVIARGGLVEVINKKLWQEIIKGLRLPSSITSAAFTLRTQYMKYLYEYECEKKNLSTRHELDVAIEGNKREGRRASCGQYDQHIPMPNPNRVSAPVSLAQLSQHMQPLSLMAGGGRLALGGSPLAPTPPPHLAPHDIELRVREYMKLLQHQHQHRDMRRPGSESPPSNLGGISPREAAALNALEMSRLTLWSFYNNNNHSPPMDTEPQREALNLSEASPPSSLAGAPSTNGLGLGLVVKREQPERDCPPAKRRTPLAPATPPRAPHTPPHHPPPPHHMAQAMRAPPHVNGGTNGAAFKITTRGDASTGDQQLVVSIELNGVTYEGVLFPSSQSSPHNQPHRPMVS